VICGTNEIPLTLDSRLYILFSMSTGVTQTVERLVRNGGLRGDVVDQVIAAVFDGRIRAGDRLITQKLAEQLGVSATPVREALVELEAIGVVQLLPNRGAVCRPFGPHQLHEIYQVRRVLEVEATREAVGRIDEATLRELREAMTALLHRPDSDVQWSQEAAALDRRLHTLIAEHCGSDRLKHEIDRYNTFMQAIRRYVHNQQGIQRRALEEHLHIIDALLAKDTDAAADAMAAHLRSTANGVEALMFPPVNG